MLKVGITGGIGSGKTVVAQLFELLGVPVYYADRAAKALMDSDPRLKAQLIKQFGEATYSGNRLDRAWLAAKVFNNEEQLKILNSLVHPVVINDGLNWLNSRSEPIIMKEAAIFFESGSYKEMDYMIGVSAPEELRIQRVMERDKIGRNAVLDRINRQMAEEEKLERCDFILVNNEEQLLIPQVLELHRNLLQLEKHLDSKQPTGH